MNLEKQSAPSPDQEPEIASIRLDEIDATVKEADEFTTPEKNPDRQIKEIHLNGMIKDRADPGFVDDRFSRSWVKGSGGEAVEMKISSRPRSIEKVDAPMGIAQKRPENPEDIGGYEIRIGDGGFIVRTSNRDQVAVLHRVAALKFHESGSTEDAQDYIAKVCDNMTSENDSEKDLLVWDG